LLIKRASVLLNMKDYIRATADASLVDAYAERAV
jgi:hypothetical protein